MLHDFKVMNAWAGQEMNRAERIKGTNNFFMNVLLYEGWLVAEASIA
jgi:hypothetical protein